MAAPLVESLSVSSSLPPSASTFLSASFHHARSQLSAFTSHIRATRLLLSSRYWSHHAHAAHTLFRTTLQHLIAIFAEHGRDLHIHLTRPPPDRTSREWWRYLITTWFPSVCWSIVYLFIRLCTSTLRALHWLLVPELVWRVFKRHAVALVALWGAHIILKQVLWQPARAAWTWFSSFWGQEAFHRQRALLLARMDAATSYQQWKRVASELDRLEGRYKWKESSRSPYYDWRRIRDDLQRFRQLVDEKDVAGIMRHSRSRLLRNLVGINDRRLFTVLRAGTKRLIEEYISEVVRALQLVCVLDTSSLGISTADKLSFFNETRHAFGRSALLLSGGATLGLYHTGVCKTLHENNLLPRILSGSSVGSIVAAMLGTRTDQEVTQLFKNGGKEIKLSFFPPNGGSIRRKINRLFSTGVLMDISILKKCVRANVPPYTFQEAYDRTGRIVNIVVSPASSHGNKDATRLLNYLTAPNVLVWSAALASCAIPGVYAPVELLAKDETGHVIPYLEGQVKWEDGSIQSDLPMQRLSELFNVNHFIVSQVNPHVIPFISSHSSKTEAATGGALVQIIRFLGEELKHAVLNLSHLGVLPLHPSIRYILDQKYVGDITIVPAVSIRDYQLLLINPTDQRLQQCITQSERATWRLLATIRGSCEIEFTLDECVRRMRGALILEELSCARKSKKSCMSRIRSYSTDMFAEHVGTEAVTVDGEDSATEMERHHARILKNRETLARVNGVEYEEKEQQHPPPLQRAVSDTSHIHTSPTQHRRVSTPPGIELPESVNLTAEDEEIVESSPRLRTLMTSSRGLISNDPSPHLSARSLTTSTESHASVTLPSFRPTPPRRMSTMDLARLDNGGEDEQDENREDDAGFEGAWYYQPAKHSRTDSTDTSPIHSSQPPPSSTSYAFQYTRKSPAPAPATSSTGSTGWQQPTSSSSSSASSSSHHPFICTASHPTIPAHPFNGPSRGKLGTRGSVMESGTASTSTSTSSSASPSTSTSTSTSPSASPSPHNQPLRSLLIRTPRASPKVIRWAFDAPESGHHHPSQGNVNLIDRPHRIVSPHPNAAIQYTSTSTSTSHVDDDDDQVSIPAATVTLNGTDGRSILNVGTAKRSSVELFTSTCTSTSTPSILETQRGLLALHHKRNSLTRDSTSSSSSSPSKTVTATATTTLPSTANGTLVTAPEALLAAATSAATEVLSEASKRDASKRDGMHPSELELISDAPAMP